MTYATLFGALALISTASQDQAEAGSEPQFLNRSEIMTPNDYPVAALKAEEQGTVGVLVKVDASGRVADCTVEVSSGSVALDSQTCLLVSQRAKFAPARDGSGNGITGSFHQRFTWALQRGEGGAVQRGDLRNIFSGDDYPPAAILLQHQGSTAVRLIIDTGGKVSECVVEESSGSSVLDTKTCSIFRTRARFTPARDSSGRAVPDIYRQRITWRLEDAGLPIDPWTFRIVARLSGDRKREDCGLDAGGALKDEAAGMAPCSEFAGAIRIPEALEERGRGKQTILVFDQQFVPRLVDSIGTPPDLRKYTFLGREVVKIQIAPDGAVTKCIPGTTEGSYSLPSSTCEFFGPRQFKASTGAGDRTSPIWATASLGIYSKP